MMDARCSEMLANTTDVDALCEQICRGLKQARSKAGILLPRYGTLEVQLQDGVAVSLNVHSKFRPDHREGK